MRTRRLPLFYRAAAAAGAPAPAPAPPSTITSTAPIAVNFAQIAPGSLVNIMVGRNYPQPIGGNGRSPADSSGNPTTDLQFYPGGQPTRSGTNTLKGRFTGYCDSLSVAGSSRFSIANKAYNAGTNRTTFDFIDVGGSVSDNPSIQFVGTRRTGGASGTTNTGLADLLVCEIGYTPADVDAGKVWTDVSLAFHGHFAGGFRFMDAQPSSYGLAGVNNDSTTAWCGPGRVTMNQASFGELVALSNAVGVDAWFCIGVNWSDASILAMAAWLDTALDPARHVYIELANELWNLGSNFYGPHRVLDLATADVKGFIGGSAVRNFYEERISNVMTITTQVAHGWTAGQQIWITNVGNATGAVTLLTASGTTATFAQTGADIPAGSFNPYSGQWIVGDLSTNLTPDNNTNIYAIGARWAFRRLTQISDLFRSVVGDAEMNTRFRIVYADQMFGGFDPKLFEYMRTTFPARAVGQGIAGASGAYLYGHAGAPYYSSTLNTTGKTLDQVCDDLTARAAAAKLGANFDIRIPIAATYGLKSLWYEGGPDTSAVLSLPAADSRIRAAAQYDPRAGTAARQVLTDWFSAGGDAAFWYHNGLGSATDANGAYAWGELATSLTDVAAPKMAAFIDLQATGVPVTRNVLSSVIGVPTVLDQSTSNRMYGATPVAGPYDDMRFNINVAEAGTYTLQFVYSAAGNNITVQVFSGLAQSGANFALTMNKGTFPDHSTTYTSRVFTIDLKAGPNLVNVHNTQSANGFAVLFYRSFTFIRIA